MEKDFINLIAILSLICLFINYILDCVVDNRGMNLHIGYSLISITCLFYQGQFALGIFIILLTILWSGVYIILNKLENNKSWHQ